MGVEGWKGEGWYEYVGREDRKREGFLVFVFSLKIRSVGPRDQRRGCEVLLPGPYEYLIEVTSGKDLLPSFLLVSGSLRWVIGS